MNSILFVAANHWADWGGSEKLWTYTAKHLLTENEVKIGVIIKKWDAVNPVLKGLLDASEVFHYPCPRSLFQRALTRVYYRLYPPSHGEQIFLNALKKVKPDLTVISQGANWDGLDWMELCIKHNVPFVTVSQAATEERWPNDSDAERLAVSYSKARRNYFVSKDNLRLTELQIGARLPCSSVIANPFDVPYDAPLEFPSVEPKYRMACVARFEFRAKGQDVLLEALSDPKWKGRNVAVGLYGGGLGQQHAEKLIKFFGLQETVRIMGFQSPVEIWKTNHALVLPSRYEGLPLALVEAMICGRFGIVTNVSGNAEVIENGVNGFIAEAPRAVYLDNALERAWARRSEWEGLGQKARDFIKAKVAPDPVADFASALMRLV
jgi:glycosyltransferase involved in cell wall biosynthesis